jgi:hypothetical protein
MRGEKTSLGNGVQRQRIGFIMELVEEDITSPLRLPLAKDFIKKQKMAKLHCSTHSIIRLPKSELVHEILHQLLDPSRHLKCTTCFGRHLLLSSTVLKLAIPQASDR